MQGLNDARPEKIVEEKQEKIETPQKPLSEQVRQRQEEQVQLEKVREISQEIKQRLESETQIKTGIEQKVYKNQNEVRVAVHTLLAMEDLVGGIGKNISQIAREFNNSIQSAIRAEEKIEKRSKLTRFFVGGDEQAARDLEQQVTQNQVRIQELKKYAGECNCSEEVKAILQEQIQAMEREQTRLIELANKEKQSKGIFGLLWKR
jgi:predicted RNase H-related nuclease YkuK (DUF458 family)